MKTSHINYSAWLLLILLSLIWGSSFILIKKALIAFDPVDVGAARIVFAFLAFLPIFIARFNRIDWKDFKWFLLVGLCGSGFPSFLYSIAQTHIDSAVAGVLNSLTPIFTFILAIVLFKHAFTVRQFSGIIIGFLGVLLIFMTKIDGQASFPFLYGFMIILATISYAISANTVGRFLKDTDPILISTLSFILIGPFVLGYLLQSGFTYQLMHHEQALTSFSALLILSLVGTFGANILFFKLVQITDAVFSTTVSFLIPFVALFWGFVDGESLQWIHLVAVLLILGGVFLIKKKEPAKA
ncbi:MAG: DMT family transporter [Bacteroidia bacterium]|nr:DMT family transporter [Bacteroidia bacterium]